MLTRSELVQLAQSLRDEIVLSVYLDGTSSDPATKRAWRISLDNALKDIRTWLRNSSHNEREDFERAVTLLASELGGDGAVGSRGWAAFITHEKVWYAAAVNAPMPTLAVWSTGICVSPYLRALKQEQPVWLAVVDAKHADVYRYVAGALERIETEHSVIHAEPRTHMGDAPRPGFHVGVRGTTGREAMQQDRMVASEKMLRETAFRLIKLSASDGAIFIGGIPNVAEQLARKLSATRTGAEIVDDIYVQMSEAELTQCVQRAASAVRNRRNRARIEEIVGLAAREDRGVLGELDTEHALEQRQVAELYVTRQFLDHELANGEVLVRSALAQGATIEEVSGTAADLLDRHGGIAARLRFVVPTPEEQGLAAADAIAPA